MTAENFSFSDIFIKRLIEMSGGILSPKDFDQLLNSFSKETEKYSFTGYSESNLIRILSSVFDKAFFISELLKYPHQIEILIAITANSNYLTDIVVRNPEYLYQVFDQTYLLHELERIDLQSEIVEGLEQFKTYSSKLNFLRQIKKRYILRIGLSDILGLEDLKTVTEQLSVLAKTINAKLFDISFDEILLKYKINYPASNFCLCSLGKLGGNELNYSSDVDLILFFDKNYIIKEIKKEYQEILAETALLFIKSSSQITDHGYIYRVDFRLRPDGKFSPLCKTINDYIKYYETRGEDWERQMLIKLDFVCGSKMLYKQFTDFLQPYVYPSSFSVSLKDQIKKMKMNIERQNKTKDDVKLFSGGIRDIEFSIQGLQLLNGGKLSDVRTGNTLEAIQKLSSKNILKPEEQKVYTEAYIFYRRIEHYLQLMNDTQTHRIPSEGEILDKLFHYTGFTSIDEFKNRLEEFRKSVRNIYNDILASGGTTPEILSDINFADSQKAEKNLLYLRSGLGISGQKEFDVRTINLFTKIEQSCIDYLLKSTAPDRVLENFVKIIRSTLFPSIWYREFSNTKFFERFLELCEFSQKAIDLLAEDKMLEEFFLSRRVFIKDFSEDYEMYSTNQIIFAAAVQFTLGLINTEKVSKIFCGYVDAAIKRIVETLVLPDKYFIAAMGSYGAGSMNFSSDIDLIIVTDDINKYENIQEDFQKFVQIIKKELKPFEVDFRLRAEGNKSPLVIDVSNYEKYFRERARVWEFQSLLKLRFITGDKSLFSKFKKILIDRIKLLDGAAVIKEVKQMYDNVQKEFASYAGIHIKKHAGGLQSIDFIIQSRALSSFTRFNNCLGKGIPKIIKYFAKENYDDLPELKNNYKKLRTLEFAILNLFNIHKSIVPSHKEQKALLEKWLRLKMPVDEHISNILESNNKLLEKHLG
jgi:[glutamine synthetase] adenylyltransferase / [glutamine synthetase]-adenylyl-L-tyrosine phosphorylase